MSDLKTPGQAAREADDNTLYRPGSVEHWDSVAAAAIEAYFAKFGLSVEDVERALEQAVEDKQQEAWDVSDGQALREAMEDDDE